MTTPNPTGQDPATTNDNPTGQTATPTTGAPAPWERSGETFSPERAWSLIENLRADLVTARAGQAPATPAAPEAPAPAADPPPAGNVETQLQELRAQLARERAGRKHGLDDELVELLGVGTDEQIDARGKALADRLASANTSPVPRRPVETLRGSSADPDQAPEETDPAKLAELVRSRSPF